MFLAHIRKLECFEVDQQKPNGSKRQAEKKEDDNKQKGGYEQSEGKLIYFHTRPDIAFLVSLVSQLLMINPTK